MSATLERSSYRKSKSVHGHFLILSNFYFFHLFNPAIQWQKHNQCLSIALQPLNYSKGSIQKYGKIGYQCYTIQSWCHIVINQLKIRCGRLFIIVAILYRYSLAVVFCTLLEENILLSIINSPISLCNVGRIVQYQVHLFTELSSPYSIIWSPCCIWST